MESDCFYYGVYSPEGFYSLASRQTFSTQKNYFIKGYSLSEKQHLFSLIKNELEKRGQDYVDFCADEKSIGVYSKSADLRIVDATYEKISSDAEIILLDDEVKTKPLKICLAKRDEAVKRACRFLSACRCINNDMMRLDFTNMDMTKINRFSSQLWTSTGGKLNGNVGTEQKRFVSCFTPDGVELNMDAFDIYCERITVICDRTGACAKRITDRVRRYALSAGYDVISCLCPLKPDSGAEHIIIPELKFGIFTCKYYHKCNFENGRRISASRFLSPSTLETKKRMEFSFKAYRRLMQEVFSSLAEVNRCDSELEELIGFKFNSEKSGKILQKIFST